MRRTYMGRLECAAVSTQVFETGNGVYFDDFYFSASKTWCRKVGISQPTYVNLHDLRGSRGLKLWRAVRERASF